MDVVLDVVPQSDLQLVVWNVVLGILLLIYQLFPLFRGKIQVLFDDFDVRGLIIFKVDLEVTQLLPLRLQP